MLATVVKKSWVGAAFATDVVTTALTYHILPFPLQMYSLFALVMDAFVCVREFFYDRVRPTQTVAYPYYYSF